MASYAEAEAERYITEREVHRHQRRTTPVTPRLIIIMMIVAALYYYATIPAKKPIPPKDELIEEPLYDDDIKGEEKVMDFEKRKPSNSANNIYR